MNSQFLVEKDTVFGSTVLEENSYSFVSCVVAPGFDFPDFELFTAEELLNEYPEEKDIIARLTFSWEQIISFHSFALPHLTFFRFTCYFRRIKSRKAKVNVESLKYLESFTCLKSASFINRFHRYNWLALIVLINYLGNPSH